MGAGPDPAVHHRQQHAALTQCLDHIFAGDAGAIGFEENEVGFGLLHLDAGNLRQSLRQRAGIGVVVGEPVDMVIERVDAGGGADAGLAHRAAEALLPAPDVVDEIVRACDHRADRSAQPLREIDPGRIPSLGHIARADAGGDAGIEQSRAIHVGGKPV